MRLHDLIVARQAINKKEDDKKADDGIAAVFGYVCIVQYVKGCVKTDFGLSLSGYPSFWIQASSCLLTAVEHKESSPTSVAAQTLHSYFQVPYPCTVQVRYLLVQTAYI